MVIFSPDLPDTAHLGDAGHLSDHNAIVAGLSKLNAEKVDYSSYTAKGSLVIGSAASDVGTLVVGTNGLVLLADSTQALGVKWGQLPTAAIQDGAVTAAKLSPGIGNLLTANQASVETDSSPFGAFLNCTISRSTDHAAHGSACLKAIVTAEGQVVAGLGVTTVPVTPGETITGTFALKADRNLTDVRITIQWATGGVAGAFVYRLVNATTAWVTHSLTVVVPAGVDTAGLFAWVTSAAPAGSEIYMDCFGLWRGAGGQWAMPGTPIVGLSEIATNGAVHLSGTGAPEGVITAAPGSTWLQTDATTDVKGWIKWIKATGTGNTGWVVGPEADTGRRNVAVDIDTDWQANTGVGYVRLQRVGERVYFEARLDRITASGGRGSYDTVYAAPSGFTPRNAYNIRGLALGPGGVAGFVGDLSTPGQMQVWFPSGGTWAASDDVCFTAEWYTSDAWPSSLPGSAI